MAPQPTLLVTGCGGGGSNNLIRAIDASRYDVSLVGTNAERSFLGRSMADDNYLIPWASDEQAYIETLNDIVDRHGVDLIVPTNEIEIAVVSRRRDDLEAATFLPPDRSVQLCQDKYEFYVDLDNQGREVPAVQPIEDLDALESLIEDLPGDETYWCRMREGTGSKGALPVTDATQIRQWIEYWRDVRGVPLEKFILCEYLPGRDYAVQMLWNDGELVISKACERLEYLMGSSTPSGRISTPRVGKLVDDPQVHEVSERIVRAVDDQPHGLYAIDLRENVDGVPCATEINCGRFFRISPSMNFSGEFNIAELFLDCFLGNDPDVPDQSRYSDIGSEETYYLCDIDELPELMTKSELESRFEDLT